jgi:hypothetical protein
MPHERRKERIYQAHARDLFNRMERRDWNYLSHFEFTRSKRKMMLRILRRWRDAGLIELTDLTPGRAKKGAIEFGFRWLRPHALPLPIMLYRQSRSEYRDYLRKQNNE